MTPRQRLVVAVLVLAGAACILALVAFASVACPGPTDIDPCPGASLNRAVVVVLAALAALLLVTPFAFLAEYLLRRRIAYRGGWARAARRGLLAAAVIAALGGLRLGGALTVPAALFVLILAGLAEWFAVRRFDVP